MKKLKQSKEKKLKVCQPNNEGESKAKGEKVKPSSSKKMQKEPKNNEDESDRAPQKPFLLHRYFCFKDPQKSEYLAYQLCRLYFNDGSAEEEERENILEGLKGLNFKEKKDTPNNRIYVIINQSGKEQSIALMFNENRKVLRHDIFQKDKLFTDFFLNLKNKITNQRQSWKRNDDEDSESDEEYFDEESSNGEKREKEGKKCGKKCNKKSQKKVEISQQKQLSAFILDLSHGMQRNATKQAKYLNFEKLMDHKVFYIKKLKLDAESQQNAKKLIKQIPQKNILHRLDNQSLIICSKKLSQEQNCEIDLFSNKRQKTLLDIHNKFNNITKKVNMGVIGHRILQLDILLNNYLVHGKQTKDSLINLIKKKQFQKRKRFTQDDHFPNSLLQSSQCVYCLIMDVKQNKKSKEECGGCHVKFNIYMPFCMVGDRDCFGLFHREILPNLSVKKFKTSREIKEDYQLNIQNKALEMKKNKIPLKIVELNKTLKSMNQIIDRLTFDPQPRLIAKSMNEHFFVRNLKLIKLIADKRKEKKNKPEFSTKEREVRPSQN